MQVNYIPSKQTESLEAYKNYKIEELYIAYQNELNSEVVSSLISPIDGKNIVFAYEDKNQKDYGKIAGKFGLSSAITESIIGSKSHGKFYISRSDFEILVGDFDNHETNSYIKYKNLKESILSDTVTTFEQVDSIARW